MSNDKKETIEQFKEQVQKLENTLHNSRPSRRVWILNEGRILNVSAASEITVKDNAVILHTATGIKNLVAPSNSSAIEMFKFICRIISQQDVFLAEESAVENDQVAINNGIPSNSVAEQVQND